MKPRTSPGRFLPVLTAFACCLGALQAASPVISYQGTLGDGLGVRLEGMTLVDLTFTFYEQAEGGPNLLSVLEQDIACLNGRFSLQIGSGIVTPGTESHLEAVFTQYPSVWMETTIDDEVLDPRIQIGHAARASSARDGVPSGMIILWSGSLEEIPAGWALCDGSTGTPDLRDRFVTGSSSQQDHRSSGGQNQMQLTEATMPAHAHQLQTAQEGAHHHGSFQDNYYTLGNASFWIGGLAPTSIYFSQSHGSETRWSTTSSNHTHAWNLESAGEGQPYDNRPACYTLAYIMKL